MMAGPLGGSGRRHWPQPGVQRHTLEHVVEICPYVPILDVPVPQMGDQVVEVLRRFDVPAVEQVIAVPKISLDRVPQRSAVRCQCPRSPQTAEQLVEVPTEQGNIILVSGLMPSAVDLVVLRILRPHFRIQDGASLVSAEGLEALATLSPRDEAGQRRVQTMLRRKVVAQHVDRPGWLHFFPVVPYALATLRIASSPIDMAWIEREMRSSLVIDVPEVTRGSRQC